MSIYEGSSLLLELYVCVILTIEYIYDARLNAAIKRERRKKRAQPEFETLTVGEGK